MAEIVDNDVDVGSDEVMVERKIVPRRRGTSPLAVILLVAFVATCAFVFFGDRLGLHHSPPATVTPQVATPAPPPTAP
jgi:hypothetical protein